MTEAGTAGRDDDVRRQSAFSRVMNSIRTQYSLATAFFLLVALAAFYIGSRIVLVHLIRDAEQQVKDVGLDISRIAYRNADAVKRAYGGLADPLGGAMASGVAAADLLRDRPDGLSLLVGYSADGSFRSGAQRAGGEVVPVDEGDLSVYSGRISSWFASAADSAAGVSSGIVRIRGVAHYAVFARCLEGGFVVVGAPFELSSFATQVTEGFGGYDVRVADGRTDVSVTGPGQRDDSSQFGLAPMLSEALNFYSGGFWDVKPRPFEAVFAVRDIAGNAVTRIAVSLPKAFTNVTRSALGRLTFFIAMAGIVLILPVFWFQSRVLLNPLTKMTEEIRKLGENHRSADCPRLEWKGKDEFALLAASVNSMLETISVRTVRLGHLEQRQRALIDGIPDALAVFDEKGRLVALTKQPEGVPSIPGLSVNEPPDAAVFGADAAKGFMAALSRVTARSGAESVHLVDMRPSAKGAGRQFEARLARMDDHFTLAIVRDVTQQAEEHRLRLAAEKRAMDSSKRESLTLLAAGIAHDVNNILSVILNTVEAELSGTGHEARLGAVRDAVKRGSAMTRELMAFAGETKISLVRTTPSFVVRDVQMLVEGVVGRNIALVYDLADDVPDVDADPNQIWKVFFNIVKNAGEAIGSRPGHICLSTRRFDMTDAVAATFASENPLPAGRGVLFAVSDDGPGVSRELLPRLFDPYVSSKSLGRGLGLATVRTIVEAHGGGIRVRSELDKGTVFEIYLPETKLPAVSASPDPQADAGGGGMPTDVLVVDNDELILKTGSILLKSLGITPHTARDRRESLGILRRFSSRIGTVLLDANLGGIDTVRLLEAFRIAAPGAKVVVSSGSREDDLRRMFADHPFDGFLAKPYTLAELKAALAAKPPPAAARAGGGLPADLV